MIKLLLLLVLPLSLFASKILSYNIYDRTDRVDVMITFDTPYNGKIKQSISSSTITIKLQNASIESTKLKQLSSKYIKSLSITPMSGYTKIVALVPSTTSLKASKTSDSYGLRLRFSTKTTKPNSLAKPKQTNSSPFANLPTKKGDDISQSYYIVIAILIIGILILFYIKKRVTPNINQNIPKQKTNASPWLFKENEQTTPVQTNDKDISDHNVSIRFQKSINSENSVVMLDFGAQSYLVLMGKSNVLLDKYTDNKPSTQDEFNTILQDRHKELDDFLHGKTNTNNEVYKEVKEPLQAYKERAAAMLYEDN